ncbi:MAG: hypothetical protein GX639_20235 [Fibrobacter sp.]|nr:hypothetical protein [Fibrobacter sp.]
MMRQWIIEFGIIFLTFFYISCYNTSPLAPEPLASTIVFADSTDITKMLGNGTYINPVSGIGDGPISYSSEKPNIATVDANNGEVTLIGVGTTIITAQKASTDKFKAVSASYTLTVKDKALSTIVFADSTDITKMLGSGTYINPVSGVGDGPISYFSERPDIATVDTSTGVVTLIGVGTTVITANKASTDSFKAVSANYTLTVKDKNLSTIVFVDGTDITKMIGSGTYINPVSGVGGGTVSFSSENPNIATVDSSTGVVTLIGIGTTVITANKALTDSFKAVSASYTLTVKDKNLSTIVFADGTDITKMTGSGTYINPVSGVGGGVVSFSSENPNIATVDANTGVVTLLAIGTTVITAQKASTDSFKAVSASYTLTVKDKNLSTIVFYNGINITKMIGSGTYINPLSGVGGGAVSYFSEYPNIATVDANTGVVTLIAIGTTVITAQKASTDSFKAVSASYTLTVIDKNLSTIVFENGINITKMIGSGTYINPVSSIGGGAVNYFSENPNIATVGANTGEVTLIGIGTTVITASRASTDSFKIASARYTLTVIDKNLSTIVFADGIDITKMTGSDTYINTVSGLGHGVVSYSSENPNIATVDSSTGEVTFLGIGTTIITANKASTDSFKAVSANYTLTVIDKNISTIVFTDGIDITKMTGSGIYINAVSGLGDGAVNYSSENPNIATVDSSTGEVTLIGIGTTVITAQKASTDSFKAVSASYTLTVKDKNLSTIVFADGTDITKMPGSDTYINTVSGLGDGAVSYSSENPNIATVDSSTGEVTLIAIGTTVITANKASTDSFKAVSASYSLTVKYKNLSTIEFADSTEIIKLLGSGIYTNTMSGVGDGAVSYSSEDPNIVAVDSSTGEVTLIGSGTTVITAIKAETDSFKAVSANYTIVVLEPYLPLLSISTDDMHPVDSKEDWIKGRAILNNGGTITDLGNLEIKGRGNSTWNVMPKKPYTFKLDKEKQILGMEPHKRWVLLANYSDKTLLRTTFAFNLGLSVFSNLKWTPVSRMVEVVLNNEYIGVYQIVEQIRIDTNRVDIDLDKGDFLLEVNARQDEKFNFTTTREVPFSFKGPEEPNTSQFYAIKSKIQKVEDIIYSDNFADEVNGYAKYIDVNSFVDWYLINELTKNNDAIFYTSVYMFYKDNSLYMGPLWDYDISSGNINYNGCDNPENYWIKNAPWIQRLFEDPLFVQKIKDRWNEKKNELLSEIADISFNASLLNNAANNNFKRWDILNTYVWPNRVVKGSYNEEVSELIDWLTMRYNWMDSDINQ